MQRRVAEGPMVDPHDDSRTVIMTRGLAQTVGYSSYKDPFPDDCDGPQLKTGELPGQTGCNDMCGAVQMETMINENEGNQCDGVQVVDYSQGFEFRNFEDARVKIATRERCIETLALRERKHVMDYIEQEAAFLAETAFLSFDRKLVDLAVKNGGANAVVRPNMFGEPVLTGGGWSPGNDPNNDAVGVKHVTIYWLERYREQIVELLEAATLPGAEDYMLEIEMTREAWKFCLVGETLTRTGDGGMINGLGEQISLMAKLDEKMYDKGHMMEGRKFDTWHGKIRVIFNDKPIRGFLRETGQTTGGDRTYNFIRVQDYINVPSEEAGLRTISNPDYRRNTVECEGQTYPLLELIPHIHPDSFMRRNLTQGIGPKGVNPLGANFQIQLLKGEYLSSGDCPNFGDKKYRYFIEHKFRWVNSRNEFSGFIMHRRFIMPGYDIDIINNELILSNEQATATPRSCNVGEEERCVPECPEMDCPADGSGNTIELQPCGGVNTSFYGDRKSLRVAVCRDADCSDDQATVDFVVADGTAIKDTHYAVLDDDGNVAPATGQLVWQPGESGCKYICFDILAALPDDPDTQDTCCNDIEGNANPATFSISLAGPIGTTLGDCSEVEVSINNRV